MVAETRLLPARRHKDPACLPACLPAFLQGYRTNSAFTNHSILSLLRRVANPRQLDLEPMLYQVGWGGYGVEAAGSVRCFPRRPPCLRLLDAVGSSPALACFCPSHAHASPCTCLPGPARPPPQISILRLFEAMLSDLAIKRNPQFAELLDFAKHTTRNMFARWAGAGGRLVKALLGRSVH